MNVLISHPFGAIIIFTLLVGVISTLILDLYAVALERAFGIPQPNWGAVGYWLKGMTQGQFVLSPRANGIFTSGEYGLGWFFHYAVGCAYAAMLPLIWGVAFIGAPTLLPVLLIGVVLTTMAGLMLMAPGMGGGFLGRKTPNPSQLYGLMLLSHAVFAMGQYIAARGLAHFL